MADIDKNFNGMTKYGWPLTFQMTGKFPLLAKRIFPTKDAAEAYINDLNDTAIPGIILTVVDDTTESNNGAYFVKSVKTSEGGDNGLLVKMGSETVSDLQALTQRVTALENKVFKVVLTTGQFDESSYVPKTETIPNLDPDVTYLVPVNNPDGTPSNQYIEWNYIESENPETPGSWEMVGSPIAPIESITNGEIDGIIAGGGGV